MISFLKAKENRPDRFVRAVFALLLSIYIYLRSITMDLSSDKLKTDLL